MKKKVTIQDIADALGISRNTVSKAINNTEGLADATRERILQKAMEMGYKQFSYVGTLNAVAKPEPAAPAERGFQGEIALLTTAYLGQSHFASLMLDKFQRELSQLGYILSSHRVNAENLTNRTLPMTLLKERVSAIVCIEMFDKEYDKMICGLGIPVLFIDSPPNQDGAPLPADHLYMDNTAGITRLVNDMLQRGKRRIGFVGNYNHCQSFFERYLAFRNAMMLAEVSVEKKFCICSNHGYEIEAQLAQLSELPDLFICANDFVAIEVIQALKKMGKSVPGDVMLCGFDDSAESRIISPALTTVHIHTQIMAYSATHLLMTRIKEPSLDFRMVHTETTLILRESTND